jgi:type II secretory ATPase GspE/PulE/Tfp pilus assembly ATPase PilB-like protein
LHEHLSPERKGDMMALEKIGLDFSTALRSILRQNSDVILIGEIRDLKISEVAFNTSLTGHQVFSSLHTNSAIATLARSFDSGLKAYIVTSAIEAIIAQRLVRKICSHCKQNINLDQNLFYNLASYFQNPHIPQPVALGATIPVCEEEQQFIKS